MALRAAPALRDWTGFHVLDDDSASFQWRTGADVVREVARRFVAGELAADLDASEGRERAEPERLRDALELLGGGFSDPAAYDDPASYYGLENDRHYHDASAVLPLPEWATREQEDEGGPGSGYSAARILLEPGRRLADLADWLANWSPPAAKRKARRGGRARKPESKEGT